MKTLNERIQDFYDRSTPLWLDTWGEHMHHGHYGADGADRKDHRQAQIDLVTELLRWSGVDQARRILDAGCGVGGSARLLAALFDAGVRGLTLSPVQAEQARRYTRQAGLDGRVHFDARDMMTLRAGDGPFDLVWSLESAEHIADKRRLLEVFYEVLAPGGRFVMATWCRRTTPPPLTARETRLLDRLSRLYHLPPMVSIPALSDLARESGFRQVRSADWSAAVAPFWGAVLRSALSWKSLRGLLRAGAGAMRGAWAMQYMMNGYRRGLITFGVFTGQK